MVGRFPLKPVLVRLRGFRVVVFFTTESVLYILKSSFRQISDLTDLMSSVQDFGVKTVNGIKSYSNQDSVALKHLTCYRIHSGKWLHRKKKILSKHI